MGRKRHKRNREYRELRRMVFELYEDEVRRIQERALEERALEELIKKLGIV